MTVHCTVPSPVGDLLLAADDAGLTGLYFAEHRHGPGAETPGAGASAPSAAWTPAEARPGAAADVLAEARAQLVRYFAGELTAFTLPLAARGTPFQVRVWHALRDIPFGGTISYAELARRVGAPTAVRAVGGANARNPISVVVPCHRVVGADGSLTGFGGGVERKRWLLAHEARHGPGAPPRSPTVAASPRPLALGMT